MSTLQKCDQCDADAVWLYAPGGYKACDGHVPRGCSCNSELKEGIDYESDAAKDPANYDEPLDEKGRRYPCCEWWYFEDGIPIEANTVETLMKAAGFVEVGGTDAKV